RPPVDAPGRDEGPPHRDRVPERLREPAGPPPRCPHPSQRRGGGRGPQPRRRHPETRPQEPRPAPPGSTALATPCHASLTLPTSRAPRERARPRPAGWRRGRLPGGRGVGPPSPVRRSKSGESGERVTETASREPPPPTGPGRLARPRSRGARARATSGSSATATKP